MKQAAYEKGKVVDFQHFDILFWIVATVATVAVVVKIVAVEIHDLVEFLKKLWQNPKDNK